MRKIKKVSKNQFMTRLTNYYTGQDPRQQEHLMGFYFQERNFILGAFFTHQNKLKVKAFNNLEDFRLTAAGWTLMTT